MPVRHGFDWSRAHRTFYFSGLTLLSLASVAVAAPGRLEATWGGSCTPVVANIESPAAGPLSLVVSVIGNDESHRAYEVGFYLANPQFQVPDAWRFDAAGCQAPIAVTMREFPLPTAAKSCPAFHGDQPSIQIRDYALVEPGNPEWPAGVIRARFVNIYPAGNTTSADQGYHLVTFAFDHTYSVAGPTTPGLDCGGFEQPIQLFFSQRDGQVRSMYASYVRTTGEEVEFPPCGFRCGLVLTVNGSLPVREATWGGIKSVYRR